MQSVSRELDPCMWWRMKYLVSNTVESIAWEDIWMAVGVVLSYGEAERVRDELKVSRIEKGI